MSRRKKIFIFLALDAAVLLMFSFPLLNLVLKPGVGKELAEARKHDAAFAETAAILQAKCGSCHVHDASLPFYAGFPIASSVIQRDIDAGLASYTLVDELAPVEGPPTEPALAKLEYSLDRGTMPPGPYLMLHWDGGLSTKEREAVFGWIRNARRLHYGSEEVIRPLRSVETDPTKVVLGKALYHDKRLSGDDTVSCATCHDLGKGGTDRAQFSTGIRNQMGDINAPTTFNSGFQFAQFWDGREPTLEAQAGGPVVNPIEMGAEWPAVLAKLKADEPFAKAFTAAYPSGLIAENVQQAIAEFERTLVTPDSKFDRFLEGDARALSSEEKKGYDLFLKHACATCHTGQLLGGGSYEKMGVLRDYFAERGGKTGKADDGRFNVSKKESDRHRFKVPTLRNIAQTAPYFHDGATADLKEAVLTMARVQRDLDLSGDEAKLIVKFLETLTGWYEGKLVE